MRAGASARRRRVNAARLLALVVALLSPAASMFAQATQTARPKIVVLVADDLGWRDSGSYGNTAIGTPHLEALARSGLLVKRAFGTTPQCSPSRISILSGRYPHATRAEDLHTPLPASERLLPSYLQADGYFTGHMAKTHSSTRTSAACWRSSSAGRSGTTP